MTKQESDEVTRCLDTIKAAIDPMPAGLDRSLAQAAMLRLTELLDGSHGAASHSGKPRRARKKKPAEPAPTAA